MLPEAARQGPGQDAESWRCQHCLSLASSVGQILCLPLSLLYFVRAVFKHLLLLMPLELGV